MELRKWCWIFGISGIWIANFGLWWTFILISVFLTFSFGVFFQLYSKTEQPLSEFRASIFSEAVIKSGIRNISEKSSIDKESTKFDKRLTGSQVIDESLHEIITFLLRDFVSPWYSRLSVDEDFTSASRESLQRIVVNTASRIKDVAWIPFLTTRLVDDAASHLRLYRLACERTKIDSDLKKSVPQSLASFKSATLCSGGHSRNSSDGKISTPKTHSRNSSISDKPLDLETEFFKIESDQEHSRMCHDQICTNREVEKSYLESVLDVILYLVLSPEDFQCLPGRILLREIVIGGLVLPLIDMVSEPDYINRCLVWLCSDVGLTSEAFITTLRYTGNKEELLAIMDLVLKEIAFLRSRDSGGEGDAFFRQQLNSLVYVKKVIDGKLQGGLPKEKFGSSEKVVILPLAVILKNSLALSYFIDYLSSVEMQNYIFLHLSIESWRASARVEKQRVESPGRMSLNRSGTENLREMALDICQQYLSDQVASRVRLDSNIEDQLLKRINHETVSDSWFDDLILSLYKKLSEKCLPEFYRSNTYLKLLSELDLDADLDDDSQSPDSLSLSDSLEDEELTEKKKEPDVGDGKFQLKVEIIDSGVVQDRGKTYGIYALSVVKTYQNGFTERWHVYRRYSDFYDLQQKVKDTYSDLGKLPFPGKKTFNNMGSLTLAKRMKMLNDYMQILLQMCIADNHPRLAKFLAAFLEPAEYDKAGTLSSALESVVSPIKSSMRTVGAAMRTVPDNLLSSVDGLSRSLQQPKKDSPREPADNVPLRIILMLMDELFDLQSRNQWLRRRIVVFLRQIFGDMVNKKILDYVEDLTGAPKVAGYLASIKEALWPNGVRASSRAERDDEMRLRTRIVAKTALLSALGDDIKHLLGSETTRRGLLRVYNTFQHPGLNRRLVYVLMEGVLEQIFPPIIDIHSKFAQTKEKKII